jgi:hypothetical protein
VEAEQLRPPQLNPTPVDDDPPVSCGHGYCGAPPKEDEPPDPFLGIKPRWSVWESIPTWWPDADGNYHSDWDEVKLEVQAEGVEMNLTGTPTSLAKNFGDGVSTSLPGGLSVTISNGKDSEGFSGTYELPVDLGKVGAGTRVGVITIPHTGGRGAPGVDTTVSYGRTYTFDAPAGAGPVKVTATFTHHSVFIPGPDRYRDAARGVFTVFVVAEVIILAPAAAPALIPAFAP